MGNIKRLEPLTGWLTYELETTLLDPPILKVRLRPTDTLSLVETAEGFGQGSRALLETAIGAVVEWDLAEDGKALVIESGTKAAILRPLMAETVKGRGTLLALAIFEDSANRENFLKN